MASPPNAFFISSDYSPYDDSSSTDQPNSTPLSGKLLVAAIIVIFCCAFFIVTLHIFGKWLWRSRTRNFISRQQQGDFQAHAPIGLSKAAIASLPTFIYTEAANMADTIDDMSQSTGSLECAVCLSEFQQDEKGRVLPSCKHCFHIECIDMWFYSHSTCPLCRAMVIHPLSPSAYPAHTQQESIQMQEVTAHDIHIAIDSTLAILSTLADGRNDVPAAARMPSPGQPDIPVHNPQRPFSSASTRQSVRRHVPHITIDIPTTHEICITSPGCISLPSRRLRYVSPHDQPCSSHPQLVESPGIHASLKRIMSMQAGKGKGLLEGGNLDSPKLK
ncbi:hypothetical protein L7F22_025980 [Adiantum nelumboides]|nr:hypothetical protein [Adiantum nelumboides]